MLSRRTFLERASVIAGVSLLNRPLWALEAQSASPVLLDRARALLKEASLIDTHNDLPSMLLDAGGDLTKLDLGKTQPTLCADVPRMREGCVGVQGKFPPPGGTNVIPYGAGFVYIKPEAFRADFAAGVPKSLAHFMAISQVPAAAAASATKATVAGWSKKPSYATIGLKDRRSVPISCDSWRRGRSPKRSSCPVPMRSS